MIVVIDTNIIIGNYPLRFPAFEVFCKHFPQKKIDVYFSQVSWEEVMKNHKDDIEISYSEYKKALKSLNRTLSERIQGDFPNDFCEKEHEKYKAFLKKQLTHNNIRILPYPETAHKEIVEYSVLKRKPFKLKDTGYKDFLIWNSILELIKTRKIVFITKDSDFNDNGNLHNDFKIHLKEKGFPDNAVEICSSINEFNDKYLKDVYKLVQYKDLYSTSDAQQNLFNSISKTLEKELENFDISDYNSLHRVYSEPAIKSSYDYTDFNVIQIDVFGEDDINIRFTFTAECEINFFIDKHDLYEINEDEMPDIIDDNWNEWTVLAEDTVNIKFDASIFIDNQNNVLSFEIIEIKD